MLRDDVQAERKWILPSPVFLRPDNNRHSLGWHNCLFSSTHSFSSDPVVSVSWPVPAHKSELLNFKNCASWLFNAILLKAKLYNPASMAQWFECRLINQEVACPACRLDP